MRTLGFTLVALVLVSCSWSFSARNLTNTQTEQETPISLSIGFDHSYTVLSADLLALKANIPEGEIQCLWDFGDGSQTSLERAPNHRYYDSGDYVVTLSVTWKDSKAVANASVRVTNRAPTVSIFPSYSSQPTIPISYSAIVTDTSPRDVAAGFTYLWEFGDGTPNSTASSPSKTYAVGNYTVKLTVTDASGGATTVTAPVTISTTAPLTLSASIISTPTPGLSEGSTVSFAGQATGGSSPYNYSWSFPDGTANTAPVLGQTVSHQYPNSGSFQAQLTITDGGGRTATANQTLSIANVPPTVSTPASMSGTVGQVLAFAALASDPSPADTAGGFTYSWTFGDQSTSSMSAPTHAYATAGIYSATVSVKTVDNAVSNTATITVTINTPPPPPGTSITTPNHTIPNFGDNPTISAASTGLWSAASTWSPARVPIAGDKVSIPSGKVVTYDVISDALIQTVSVQASGQLVFRNDVDTRLTVTNLLVLEGGTLQIGTAASPIQSTKKAEVVLGSLGGLDSEQFGVGLIALGTVTMQGGPDRSPTFVRLSADAKAGDTQLQLAEAATAWKVDDTLVLPDSRQMAFWFDAPGIQNQVPENRQVYLWEEVGIASLSTDKRTITLKAPVKYSAHMSSKDAGGQTAFFPHVGNLTRNVVVRSLPGAVTRGYTLFHHHASVNIKNAEFVDLGRTLRSTVLRTGLNITCGLTGYTVNQPLRYPVTFDLVNGALFENNSVHQTGGPSDYRHGIALYGSPLTTLKGNVVYNVAGSGIIVLTASTINSTIDSNFIAGVRRGSDISFLQWERNDTFNACFSYDPFMNDSYGWELGFEGAGIFLRSTKNYVRNNVVASVAINGLVIWNYDHQAEILEFSKNEAYGVMAVGLYVAGIGVQGDGHLEPIPNFAERVISETRIWHHHTTGYLNYDTNHLTLDGLVMRGNPTLYVGKLFPDLSMNAYLGVAATGIGYRNYLAKDLKFKNVDIQGQYLGYVGNNTTSRGGTITFENGYFRNYVNMRWDTPAWYQTTGAEIDPRKTVVRNIRFDLPSPGVDVGLTFDVLLAQTLGQNSNHIVPDDIWFYDYDGVAGLNYKAYYLEQTANSIIPDTAAVPGATRIGAPPGVTGLTNAVGWANWEWRLDAPNRAILYQQKSLPVTAGWNRLSVAGSILPSGAIQMPTVRGYLAPF